MTTAVTPELEPGHAQTEERPTVRRDPSQATREQLKPRSLDPTRDRKLGSGPYDDPTQGRTLGSGPYGDPTQGRTLGSGPYDDPTRVR